MRVLVLGATGFLGKKLVKKLCLLGFEVVAVGRKAENFKFKHPKVNFFSLDIAQNNLDNYLVGSYDAAVSLVGSGWSGEITDNNLAAVANVEQHEISNINFLYHLRNKTNRIIFASSQAVYGLTGSLKVCENFETNPTNSYGCSKLNAENWYKLHQKKFGGQVFLLRFTGFVDGGGLIDYLINSCLNKTQIELHNGGITTRDYMDSEDAIDAIIQSLTCNFISGVFTLNIGSGSSMKAIELCQKIKLITKSNVDVILGENSKLNLDFGFNIEQARKIIRFNPKTIDKAVDLYTEIRCAENQGKEND